VQKLIAIFPASSHIARILVLLRAQQVSTMCVAEASARIEALPDQSMPVKARASRARFRRLAALTGIACSGV
jgi:hypothetical protein